MIAPAFLVVVLILEVTPGPNMTTLALLTLERGRAAGLAAALGVALGLTAHAVAVGCGAGLAIARFPGLFEVLRWAGVLYLVWLAYEAWQPAVEPAASAAPPQGSALLGLVGRGFLLNLLNPKSILFFLVVVPRFVEPSPTPPWLQSMVLGIVYVAIATAIHTVIVLLAAQFGPALRDGVGPVVLRRILAILLAAVAVWLGLETGMQA